MTSIVVRNTKLMRLALSVLRLVCLRATPVRVGTNTTDYLRLFFAR
jgi:hypothetical protein